MRAEAEDLSGEFPGRFILGLGVSHAPLVASLGHSYLRPLQKMEKFLDELDHPAQRGADRQLPPIVLAALGPKMLRLSRDQTLGAHPYFTTPERTAFARSVLGPSPLLVPEQAVSLARDATEGLAAGRAYCQRYLRLPNYTRNLERFGFERADFADGGSDRLISAVVPSGASTVLARVREHLDAGADHVLIQPLGADGGFAAGAVDELAAAVTELMKRSLQGEAHRPGRRGEAYEAAACRTPVTSYRWCTGSWTRYLPNVSTVNTAPSLRRPGRRHWSALTAANRPASACAASLSCSVTCAGSCST